MGCFTEIRVLRSDSAGLDLGIVQDYIDSFGIGDQTVGGNIKDLLNSNGDYCITEIHVNCKSRVCGNGCSFYAWSERYVYFMTRGTEKEGKHYYLDCAPRFPNLVGLPETKGD